MTSDRQTRQPGRGEFLLAQDRNPFSGENSSADQTRVTGGARIQQLEREPFGGAVEEDKAQLVDDDQGSPAEPLVQPARDPGIPRLAQLADELSALARTARKQRQVAWGDDQDWLAGANRSGDHSVARLARLPPVSPQRCTPRATARSLSPRVGHWMSAAMLLSLTGYLRPARRPRRMLSPVLVG